MKSGLPDYTVIKTTPGDWYEETELVLVTGTWYIIGSDYGHTNDEDFSEEIKSYVILSSPPNKDRES